MDEFFSIPLIVPPADEGDFQVEAELLFKRSLATRDWLNGELSTNDFMDLLDTQNLDIIQIASDWSNGITYFGK
jgi:hypothetical protein